MTDVDVLTDRDEVIALDQLPGPDGTPVDVASRTVRVGELTELTSWHRGREVERTAARVDDDG